MATSKKAERLLKRLTEIETELKTLQNDFCDIKKRTRTALVDGLRKRDAKKIDEIRKQLLG